MGLTATTLSDGSLDVGGRIYDSPSAAAFAITGSPTNGWWYFLGEDKVASSSLRQLRRVYAESMTDDIEDVDDIEDDDEEEDESI